MSVFTIYFHFIESAFHELMAQVIFMLNLTLSDADSVDTEKIQKYGLYKNIIQDLLQPYVPSLKQVFVFLLSAILVSV